MKDKKPKPAWIILESAAEIGAALIKDRLNPFNHLERARILYLGKPSKEYIGGDVQEGANRPSTEAEGLVALACSHQPFSYVLEIPLGLWDALAQKDREAFIFHKLCHLDGLDIENGVWGVRKGHDVNEFTAVLAKYGPWLAPIREFLRTGRQLELDFDDAGPR
jgi:hypothetical protein